MERQAALAPGPALALTWAWSQSWSHSCCHASLLPCPTLLTLLCAVLPLYLCLVFSTVLPHHTTCRVAALPLLWPHSSLGHGVYADAGSHQEAMATAVLALTLGLGPELPVPQLLLPGMCSMPQAGVGLEQVP